MYYDLHRYLCLTEQSTVITEERLRQDMAIKVGLCKWTPKWWQRGLSIENRRKIGWREDHRVFSIMDFEGKSCSLKDYPLPLLSKGLRDMDDGVIFPGQCQGIGKKEREEGFCVYLKYEALVWHLGCKQSFTM